MPQRLSEVELDEVSLVDEPANQLAKVVLVKRNTKPEVEEEVEKAVPAGIKFVIGFQDDDDEGSEVQSVVFDSSKWDAERAKKWLEDHKMEAGKVDETENTFRFRQMDPEKFSRFRMITPGRGIAKALKARDSLSRINTAIDTAVRGEFGDPSVSHTGSLASSNYIFIRDLYKDSIIFEQDGQIWRAEYGITYGDDGEIQVNVGNKIPVEMVYQDVKKAEEVSEEVTDEDKFRLSAIRANILMSRFR